MTLRETLEKMYKLSDENGFNAHISMMKRKAAKGLLEGITPDDIDEIANEVMSREDDPTLEKLETITNSDDSKEVFHQDEEVDITPDGSFAYTINDMSNVIREFGDLADLEESADDTNSTILNENDILTTTTEKEIGLNETLENLLGGE